MYYRRKGLRNMWVVKFRKGLMSEHLAKVNMLNGLKNCTTALSSYCLITLAKTEMKNVGLSISEMLGVFFNTLTADNKYSLRNRKNLRQPIQLQLFKKQKFFFSIFSCINEIYIKCSKI